MKFYLSVIASCERGRRVFFKFEIFKIFITLCLNTRSTLQSPEGHLVIKVFLLGSSSCWAARPAMWLRRSEDAQALHHQQRKCGFSQSLKPKYRKATQGFQVQGECFGILCKAFLLLGTSAALHPLMLRAPWLLVRRASTLGRIEKAFSRFTKNEHRHIIEPREGSGT